MDLHRQNNMIYKAKDILKQVDYNISYNFEEDVKLSKVHVSWDRQDGDYVIKWNEALSRVYSNFNNLEIPCPNYAAPSVANLVLRNICRNRSYPYKYVFFQIQHQNTVGFCFDSCGGNKECQEKASALQFIIEDILDFGLKPEHTDLAKENGVLDGLEICMKYYLGLDLAGKESD